MKTFKFPKPVDGLSFLKIWEDIVYPQPGWRSSLANTRIGIALDDKFRASVAGATLTDAEHELLERQMQMQGLQVGPPVTLRFFMRGLEAVQNAESVDAVPEPS